MFLGPHLTVLPTTQEERTVLYLRHITLVQAAPWQRPQCGVPGFSLVLLQSGWLMGRIEATAHAANCSPPGHYLADAAASKYCISSHLKMTGALRPAEAGTGGIQFKR